MAIRSLLVTKVAWEALTTTWEPQPPVSKQEVIRQTTTELFDDNATVQRPVTAVAYRSIGCTIIHQNIWLCT